MLVPLLEELYGKVWPDLCARYGFDVEHPVRVECFPVHNDFSARTVGFTGFGALGVCFGEVFTLVSKSGQPMAFLRLDDSVSQVEVVVFNSTYAQAREFLHEDAVILVKGRVERQGEGETKVKAFEVLPFDAVPLVGEVRLRVDARTAPSTFIDDLARVIKDFPGESPVVVDVDTSDGRKRLRLGPGFKVRPAPDFFAEVRVLGSEAQLV